MIARNGEEAEGRTRFLKKARQKLFFTLGRWW
jgi:hypothetical protein